jgi:hypothetical protein
MNNHSLPPLPTLRVLTRMLRDLHAAWSHPECGPEVVALYCDGAGWHDAAWSVGAPDALRAGQGWPGVRVDDTPGADNFDAVGAARRLLASARDAGFK